MSRRMIWVLIVGVLVSSCSTGIKKNLVNDLTPMNSVFNYEDKNGLYYIKLSTLFDSNAKVYTTKKSMELPRKNSDNIIEQSISTSSLGAVKKKAIILRPKMSQYNVWFDGKKYSSEIKINTKHKAIDLKMSSPEKEWNGSKQIKFPNTNMYPCFFNQIIECVKVSGFIDRSSKAETGSMSLLIVWEGYPYLSETFSDVPSELFTEAEIEYDGKTKQNERRYNLRFAGQSIFYVLNEQSEMIKMFWVSQGISMINKSIAKKQKNQEESEIE